MQTRSKRPTTPPSFDVIQYAKDSDARMRTVRPATDGQASSAVDHSATRPAERQELPRSETRLVTRPTMGAAITDEGWARGMVGAPTVVIPDDQLRRLPLDHRAGFLLSLMDGTIDLATIIEVSAMPPSDALRIVRDLFDAGVVAFRQRAVVIG